MLQQLRTLFLKRSLKKSIRLALTTIYTEQFDIDVLVGRLAPQSTEEQMLQAYVAIQIATQLPEPLDRADIDHALEEFLSSKARLGHPDFQSILTLRKDLAEMYWFQRTNDILERKLAAKTNPYSYEAGIYHLESVSKEPASTCERQRYEQLAAGVEDSQRKLDEYLDEKASREAMDAALERMIAEVEAEKTKGGK